jgi:uncharacterized protein YcbX
MPRVSGLFVYPVKSCRGHAVTKANVDAWGFEHDRRYVVVTAADGRFLTQRQHPRMALIETELAPAGLTLASPRHGSVFVPRAAPEPRRPIPVTVWSDTVQAEDCGDAAAEWLSRFLGLPLRLARMGAAFHRPVKPKRAPAGHELSFADGAPFLLVSDASLHDLNDRIVARGGEGVPMDRFRPNVVLTNCAPWAEDSLGTFRLGDVTFRNAWPCARCIVTTTDQETAQRGKEPLATLATFRRDAREPTDVNFGVNLIHETKTGAVRVGDELIAFPR